MKSPLKQSIHFKSANELKNILKPNGKISSFYLYSGAIETYLSSLGFKVISHTNKRFMYDFWSFLKNDCSFLVSTIESIYPTMNNIQLYSIREFWHTNKKPLNRSCLFYILNMCSDDGKVSTGNLDISKLNNFHTRKLKNFRLNNFYPFLDEDKKMIDCFHRAKETDYILLPIGKYSLNLFEYGKNKGPEMYTFNHKEIHARVKDLDKKCILLYKNHPALFNLYKSFNIRMVDRYGRVADNKESCEDLIITNF